MTGRSAGGSFEAYLREEAAEAELTQRARASIGSAGHRFDIVVTACDDAKAARAYSWPETISFIRSR